MSPIPRKFKDELNLRLVGVAIIVAISCISFGYDSTWWTGAIGQVYFNLAYGDRAVVTPLGTYHILSARQTSLSVAISYAFQAVGQILSSYIIKIRGRKAGILVFCGITVLGTLIEITGTLGSGRYWQIVGGKWIVSIALGIALGTAPLYLAECAPPVLRGSMVNTASTMVVLGSFFAGVANYGVGSMAPGPAGLRILIGVQFIPPALALVTIFFLPESPRWLAENGKIDQARATLVDLRRQTRTGPEVDQELLEIQSRIAAERANNESSSWSQCFRGVNLQRTLTVLGVQCFLQVIGLAFLGNYAVVYLQQIGIGNVFTILIILYGVLTIATCVGFYTQDRLGRRFLLLGSGVVCAAALFCLGALTTRYPRPSNAPLYASVFCIFLFSASYAIGWANVPYTLTSEIPADNLRPKTWAIAGTGNALSGLVVGLVNPYLQDEAHANLQGKVAFIYASCGVVAILFVFFLVPELKGRSWFEIQWLYTHRIAPRKMGGYKIPDTEYPTSSLPDDAASGMQEEKAVEERLEHC